MAKKTKMSGGKSGETPMEGGSEMGGRAHDNSVGHKLAMKYDCDHAYCKGGHCRMAKGGGVWSPK